MKIKCQNCQKQFYISPSRAGVRKTCSLTCKNTLQLHRQPWNKGKKCPMTSKERNGNWKGGVTADSKLERKKFHDTIRLEIFARDNFSCVLCSSNKNLQVDHIQPWAEYVEGRFDMNNCRTLCAKCHYELTFSRPMSEDISAWGHNFSKGGRFQ